jgi:hypothetical protein
MKPCSRRGTRFRVQPALALEVIASAGFQHRSCSSEDADGAIMKRNG